MESRILTSPVNTAPWAFSAVPDDWRVEPRRNVIAGTLAAVVSLPLSMGLGALAFSPFGPEYVTTGVLAGLYAAAFLGLVAVLAGARGVAIYSPRSLVSFMIAAVCADLLVGARWLPNDDPLAVTSAVFLLLAMAGAFQFVFGLARLARLVKFIPTPVMAGFQNAAAIIITLSQLHVLLGFRVGEEVAPLTPHRPHRADFPQRVPQVRLTIPAQGWVIRGRSSGWRRRSCAYTSQERVFPRVLRLSHFFQSRRTP